MLNFLNQNKPIIQYDPNDPSTYKNKLPPGLSKHWRYSSLDAQNSQNNFPHNYNNYNNYQNNNSSPSDGITIEVSYDNFYALGVDMIKKKKYAEELKQQIEENKMRKQIERQNKKLQDLADDIRVEKERKIIEQRLNQDKKFPKLQKNVNFPKIQNELPKSFVKEPKENLSLKKEKYITPIKLKKNLIKYNYLNTSEDTNNFLKQRNINLEKFGEDMNDQLKLINQEFSLSMKKLNNEVNGINILNNKNLLGNNINEIREEIKNNKDINICTEHVYNIFKSSKDGKKFIGQYVDNPDYVNLNGRKCYVKTPINYNNGGKYDIERRYRFLSENKNSQLPYINLSHSLSYNLQN